MDIDLLAKMVKEMILDNDAVTLPGVGSFVADLVPSAFSDKGYTIHPPYRRLYFSPKQGSDTLLVDLYARSNDVDRSTAERIVGDFLSEMKEVLKVRKTIMFPGLGRLRATRENHFFFVADEDLDIYPGGFGLEPVSLKTHVETSDEVASAVAGLAELVEMSEEGDFSAPLEMTEGGASAVVTKEKDQIVMTKEEDPVVVEGKDAPVAAAEEEALVEKVEEPVVAAEEGRPGLPGHDEEVEARKGRKIWLVVLGILLGVVVLAIVIWAVLGRVAPEMVDRLLYSADELEILRY